MKFHFERYDNRKELDDYTDDELDGLFIDREQALKALEITNFEYGLSKKGNFVFRFDTENFKYLNIECYGYSPFATEDRKDLCSRSIKIGTEQRLPLVSKGDELKIPIQSIIITIEPENEFEAKLVEAEFHAVANRWEYQVLFMPWSDFVGEDMKKVEVAV